MLSRLQQSLVAFVAVVVLGLLWFVGNDKGDVVPVETTVAPSAMPASTPRGVPRNGTLDPISIDPNRPADVLPEYQADNLFADYRDNAGGADDRYRGKYFIVEGVASGIRRDAGNNVFLEIRTSNPGELVRANLLRQQICGPAGRTCEVEARATMVRRGQKVAVECTGAGQEAGTPLLTDCLIRGGAN